MTFKDKIIKGWEWPRSTFVPHLSTTINYPVHTISLENDLELYGARLNNYEFVALTKMNDGSFREIVDATGTAKVINLSDLPPMISQPTAVMSDITITLAKKTTEGSLDDYSGIKIDTLDTNDPGDKATRAFRVNILESYDSIGDWINNDHIRREMLDDFQYEGVQKSELSEWAQRKLIKLIEEGHIKVSPYDY